MDETKEVREMKEVKIDGQAKQIEPAGSAETPVIAKKPRGRPKKIKDPAETAEPKVKKPRGRPKKVKIDEPAEPAKPAEQETSVKLDKSEESIKSDDDDDHPVDPTNLEGFNLEKIFKERPMLTLLIGRSKSGKTYMTKFLIYYLTYVLKLFKFGIVFTGTGYTTDYNYIDEKYVMPGFSDNAHNAYVKKLQKMKKELGDNMPDNFIIYDDLLGILDKSNAMEHWWSVFRHTKTHLFLLSQYLNSSASSPLVRIQTGMLIAFDDRTKRTRNSLFEWFGGSFDTQKEFNQTYSKATKEDHSAMVFVHGRKTRNDSYFSIKAPAFIPDIKLTFGKKKDDQNNQNNKKQEPSLAEHIEKTSEISKERHNQAAVKANEDAKKLRQSALSQSEMNYLLAVGKKYGL